MLLRNYSQMMYTNLATHLQIIPIHLSELNIILILFQLDLFMNEKMKIEIEI